MSKRNNHPEMMRGRAQFTMTADVQGGTVTFGLVGKRAWVSVQLGDRFLSSLDAPAQAPRIAARLLNVATWPAFAAHLAPNPYQSPLFEGDHHD